MFIFLFLTNLSYFKRFLTYSRILTHLRKCFWYLFSNRSEAIMEKQANKFLTLAFNSDNDKQHCFETNGANIVVQVQPRSTHSHGSSMVKLKSIVDYKWEEKAYPGHLIAIHKDAKVIAYSINVNAQGMVRIIHFGLNKRALIKGMASEVLDLQFADLSSEIIIGCIEETALHIHRLEVLEDSINCIQMLKIESSLADHVPRMDKISWCPFVPEENEEIDEFSGLLLVWVRGTNFECYSIRTIMDTYKSGVHKASDLSEGLLKCYGKTSFITSATFSPDGTTLAISTEEGSIQFYQIYFHEPTPRCLHKWLPHDGSAISDFFFLDNHTQPIQGNTLWKYAVTCAANNTEIKVSSCETWETLQTIKFKSSNGEPLAFKAEIDRTSSYLILSDMSNRQLYVLQILKENALSQNGQKDENNLELHSNGNNVELSSAIGGGISRVFIKSIAEFHLSSPILSFGICNAAVRRYKCALSDNYLIDELEDYDEENNSLYCVVLRLFMIQPKSVQECHILYQPALSESAELLSTEIAAPIDTIVSPSVQQITEAAAVATPLLLNVSASVAESIKPQQQKSSLNLLTPESFTSPVEKQKPEVVSQEVMSTIFMLANAANNVTSPANATKALNLTNCSLLEEEKIFQQPPVKVPPPIGKSTTASGKSTPSREVRDILLKADEVNEDEYYGADDDDDLELDEQEDKDDNMKVLDVLKALERDCDFKNIDDDEDEEDDGIEDEDENDSKKPDGGIVKPDWPKAPQFAIMNENVPVAPLATAKQMDTLSTRMNQMIEIMEQQSRYIAELRNEIYDLKGRNNAETNAAKNNAIRMEECCKKAIEQNYQKYDLLLLTRDKQNRDMRDSLIHMFQQVAASNLSQMDATIKENLYKICASKAFIDGISMSVMQGIHKSLETTFKRSLEQLMIPSYEKITHEMFRELSKSFSDGTKEYTRAFDAYMKQYNVVEFQIKEFGGVVQQIPQQVKLTNEQSIVPIFNSALHDIRLRLDKFQLKVVQDLKEQVKIEIQNGFERQTSTLEDSVISAVARSQTETPAPNIYDFQESIKQLLAHGQINKAFHQALVSSDFALVEFTLERAEFNAVFNPCPLDQTVLLSLITQLTHDMSKYNDLKNRYVNDAIVSLNMSDTVTQEHAPKIMRDLITTFQQFIAQNPTNAMNSSIKMIMLAASSIMQSKNASF